MQLNRRRVQHWLTTTVLMYITHSVTYRNVLKTLAAQYIVIFTLTVNYLRSVDIATRGKCDGNTVCLFAVVATCMSKQRNETYHQTSSEVIKHRRDIKLLPFSTNICLSEKDAICIYSYYGRLITRKPCCCQKTARCRSCSSRFKARRQHSLQV